jgi:hypothetical protein
MEAAADVDCGVDKAVGDAGSAFEELENGAATRLSIPAINKMYASVISGRYTNIAA